MTRDACLQDPVLLVILVASNLAIFAAYVGIPATMTWIAVRSRIVPFPAIWLLFGGFILSCGLAHLCAALVFFRAAWHLEAAVCVVTAIVSATTAVILWRLRWLLVAALRDFASFADMMERQRRPGEPVPTP